MNFYSGNLSYTLLQILWAIFTRKSLSLLQSILLPFLVQVIRTIVDITAIDDSRYRVSQQQVAFCLSISFMCQWNVCVCVCVCCPWTRLRVESPRIIACPSLTPISVYATSICSIVFKCEMTECCSIQSNEDWQLSQFEIHILYLQVLVCTL